MFNGVGYTSLELQMHFPEQFSELTRTLKEFTASMLAPDSDHESINYVFCFLLDE